ncbi:MAG TPA: hypothetical protein VFU31_20950 [Candidatus Binatia bacterium]|nr:hypothetical protein [Candidatus Binatia bacterium]
MSYRPITDFWFLARARLKGGVKYYGAYLGGFPERARVLIGCGINEPLLHVCGGMARLYPYKLGFGPNDKTLDLAPECEPDFLQDALAPLPMHAGGSLWPGILIDPPYSPEDAKHYTPGIMNYPSPRKLLANALRSVAVGGKVGLLHYVPPKPPPDARFVACVAVACGFENRLRCFSVFERLEEKGQP